MKYKSSKINTNLYKEYSIPSDLVRESIKQISNNLNYKLEQAIIKGLELKGFVFEDRIDLENFIKSSCRMEDNVYLKERVYFANETPFMIWYYDTKIDLHQKDFENKITATYGEYKFL